MDIRRFIIFAGLAVSSYFLFLAWNEDYDQKQNTSPNTNLISETEQVSDLPDTSVPVTTGSDAPAIENANTDVPQFESQAAGQLIKVNTDVFNIAIDPQGGEIAFVALPEYPASLDDNSQPFVLMDRSESMLYVAQSGLLGQNGIDKNGPVTFSSEQTSYQLSESEEQLQVTLTYRAENNILVNKIFAFTRGSYLIDVSYQISNNSADTWSGVFYGQLKRDRSEDPHSGNAMGMQSYLGTALSTNEEPYKKYSFDDLDESKYKVNVDGGWVGILQHYFVSAWIPNPEQAHTFNGRKSAGNFIVGFYDTKLSIAPGATATTGAQFYAGPKIQKDLAAISPGLDLTVDFSFLWWIAQPLFSVLDFIYTGKITVFETEIDLGSGVGNWGVAIILLTMLIKLAFFKLSAASYRSMANMRRVAPKMTAIREKYGDNREKLGQEMMALYKKEKINPLGGCLPILVQMPVFISLYWVLMESVELRQAPFMFWIQDLSVKDPFFVLPLIMGASMFIQMRLNPQPQDPMQAQIMKYMPIMFTIFFLWFPAGLVLYWVVNNVLSISQQWYITRKIEAED